MYLGIQRVRTPRGEQRLNGALYAHPAADTATWHPATSAAEILAFAKRPEGRVPLALRVDASPGGNRVEGLLEVAGPDLAAVSELDAILAGARARIGGRRRFMDRVDHAVVSFRANAGEEQVAAIFDELCAAAAALFSDRNRQEWLALQPLRVHVDRDEEGWRFSLSRDSRERVMMVGGAPANIGIRDEVARDFRRLQGPLYPHVAQWVTNLSAEQLMELGGVQFVDVRDRERVVGEWPARR